MNQLNTMFDSKELQKILNSSIEISIGSLSYINRLLPEFKDVSCIILHKKRFSESLVNTSKFTEDEQTSRFDITGSPLKYSFNDSNYIEDSIILTKRNWYKEEEKYLPLGRAEAITALNACVDFINGNTPPIFAVCKDKSGALGVMVKGEWLHKIQIGIKDTVHYDLVKESYENFRNSVTFHLPLSGSKASIFSIYDLYGTKGEMINWDEYDKSNFEGSLSIEVEVSNVKHCTGATKTNNCMVVQVVTGSTKSPLKELWDQLLLLNKYLNILEEYKRNFQDNLAPFEFAHDFKTLHKKEHSEIIKDLNLLLNGCYNYRNSNNGNVHEHNFSNEFSENDINLHRFVKNLSYRYNLDFTDFLWDLVIMNSNYSEMTKCIYTVFEEVIARNDSFFAEINVSNSTRIAKVISNPSKVKVASHLLSGSLSLEYIIDMGFEKLRRDYIYILTNARFLELYDSLQQLKNSSCDEFRIDTYRQRLTRMAQIHVCFEFMLLLQDNFVCLNDDLRTFFTCAFKEYVCEKSPLQNCDNLHQNTIYTLTVPLPVSALDNIKNKIPTEQRRSETSEYNTYKIKRVTHYSQLPIFPPSIMNPTDVSIETDEMYHVTDVYYSVHKFK